VCTTFVSLSWRSHVSYTFLSFFLSFCLSVFCFFPSSFVQRENVECIRAGANLTFLTPFCLFCFRYSVKVLNASAPVPISMADDKVAPSTAATKKKKRSKHQNNNNNNNNKNNGGGGATEKGDSSANVTNEETRLRYRYLDMRASQRLQR
jgi:hypothetical protein